MKRCRPEHTLLGVFFQGTLEHLGRLVGQEVAGEIQAQVPSTQAQFMPVLFYPVGDYLRLLQLGAQALVSRGRSFPAAMEALGYGSADSLFASYVGKLLLELAEKDLHQGLSGVPAVIKMVSQFGEREYQRVAEDHVRFLFRGELQGPAWMTGLFRAGIDRITQRPCTIEVGPEAFVPYQDFTLDIRWSA